MIISDQHSPYMALYLDSLNRIILRHGVSGDFKIEYHNGNFAPPNLLKPQNIEE